MLVMKNISKVFKGSFGTVRALDKINFSVNIGDIVAVRGPSGCGKTTLLLTAGAMMTPDEGVVDIQGVNPYALNPDQRATMRQEIIGFVFQQYNLIPYLSVFENVIVPAKKYLDKKRIFNRAEKLLQRFDLEDRAEHKPTQLSMGQQQRTALARALINEPQLILADEPTGSLDEENAKIVIGHLRDIAEAGTAVIIVTHDTIVEQFDVRAVELDNGKIRESELVPMLMNK